MKKIILIGLLILVSCAQPTEQPPLKQLKGPTPSGTTTTMDGHTLVYQMYANKGKPAVILLHMLGRTRTDWDSFAKWLQTKGYAVISYDSRGHGSSTGNADEFSKADFNNMVKDITAAKAVLQSQGADVSRLSIIGASIGANTAFNYATTDPDVKTIVLLSPGLDYRGVKTENTKYTKPFLIVASTEDKYSAESAQKIAQNNPTAKLVMYENAGHGTNMFVNSELAPTIQNWLDAHT